MRTYEIAFVQDDGSNKQMVFQSRRTKCVIQLDRQSNRVTAIHVGTVSAAFRPEETLQH